MYDYEILGCGKQIESINELLQKFNENVIEVVKMQKTLRENLVYNNVAYAFQHTTLSVHRFEYIKKKVNRASKKEISEMAERISDLRQMLDSTEASIKDVKLTIKECDDLLITTMEDAISDNLQFLETARYSKDPITAYLYRLYFEPDFLERVLFAVRKRQDLRMYRYHSFYFIAPGFAQINMPYQNQPSDYSPDSGNDFCEGKQSDRNETGIPLFGSSWFSPEAHESKDVLKSEYRKLAKLYHPDISENPSSNYIFSAISQEYQTIFISL